MPRKIMHGENKRFQLIWDWYAADRDRFIIEDNGKAVITATDNSDIKKHELIALVDLLNDLHEGSQKS